MSLKEDSRFFTLNYLCDSARTAHLEGNGILVNHLSAIAIEELKKDAIQDRQKLIASAWSWAIIFPLFWLTDSYMLREVENALKKLNGCNESENDLLNVLRSYKWLINQPLADFTEQYTVLEKTELTWFDPKCSPEHALLLSHIVELLWFRDPLGTRWIEIAKRFEERLPPLQSKQITIVRSRLIFQTQLVVLGAKELDNDADLGTMEWVPQLWKSVFNCNRNETDRILISESPRHAKNSPLAGLLFDVRHFNRLGGVYGDPQSIGLTRRRLINAQSPEFIFQELRKARTDSLISNELYLGQTNASDLFFGFTETMLLEIAALRRWDLTAWINSVLQQARINAIVALKEPAQIHFADRATRAALVSFSSIDSSAWSRQIIAKLELLPVNLLTALVRDMFCAHPIQCREVKKVISVLTDAIPENLLVDLARWSVRYVDLEQANVLLGHEALAIEFWTTLFPMLGEEHEAWGILLPKIQLYISQPMLWQIGRKWFFIGIFKHISLPLAIELGQQMLAIECDILGKHARWDILSETAAQRPNFAHIFAERIVLSVARPEENITLIDEAWAAPYLKISNADVKRLICERIRKTLDEAIAPEHARQYSLPVHNSLLMYYVEWSDADADLFRSLISALKNPRLIRWFAPKYSKLHSCNCTQST